ncbi:MAG: helix-turn-helix transcriptional regulator, partial [Caldilinea sp.]
MTIPMLATKLYIPPLPPKVVIRPRLIEQLTAGLAIGRKLSLIAAPAGFGKSTLASAWIAGCGRPAAWLSLDEHDGDPVRFLAYVVRALQGVAPALGAGILDALQSPQPPALDALLTALLNEIAHAPHPCILVLDDYHLVNAGQVDTALTFLLEHLPPQLHLLITTREAPALPLPRLRARNQLTDIGAADLRFTPAEAAEFLHQVMRLALTAEEVAALEQRTEGWIAGLQLAALSMQGSQDVAGFIQAFSGAHRHIVDYLVTEVLQRQPEPIRDFLLQTSILDRMNGALCDAVTAQPGGAAQLESLQRNNYFLIPLDETRTWYRYHHLFADVLRARLTAEQPDQAARLHRRASDWYAQQGALPDAIRHALAAEDFARAAHWIEQAAPALRRTRQEALILGWLQALPDAIFHNRPVLSVTYALALLVSGATTGVEERLRAAERWLEGAPATPTQLGMVVDAEQFRRLPGMIALARAGLTLAHGDATGAAAFAQQALVLAPDDDHTTRGGAAGFLGLVAWTKGDLETAHCTFSDGMVHLEQDGNVADAIAGAIILANIRSAQGRLHQAQQTYEQGLRLATPPRTFVLRGAADMHAGLSE